MTAQEKLLAECAKLNVHLRPTADGQLAIGGPRKALTTNLLERINAHKAELLAALTSASQAPGTQSTAVSTHPYDRPACWGRMGSTHRLCGNGFRAIQPKIPPLNILATPIIVCPRCKQRPVLRELRNLTGGRCYGCAIGEGVGLV
jgi:TubC N-terminal docking domain